MKTNAISNALKEHSNILYANFRNNCIVLRQMLKKYKKAFPDIADYSILHYVDIIDICELIMDPEVIAELNGDECYLILMSALFVYSGLGIEEKEWEMFMPSLKEDTGDLTKNEIIRAHYAHFSSCLLDQISDILELPSAEHKECIRTLMLRMGNEKTQDDQIPDVIRLSNGNLVHMYFLSGILALANDVSELQNRNVDLSYDKFSSYKAEDILGFVERLSMSSLRREGNILIVEVRGSDTVFSLMQRKIDYMQKKISAFFDSINEDSELKFSIRTIALHSVDMRFSQQEVFLNKEIESSWTTNDKAFFSMFTPEEKLFYINYLSSEFSITDFLKEFAAVNHAELKGLDFRVKSPSSIYLKLHKPNAERTLETIADVIRYTVIISPEKYVDDVKRILGGLEKKDWRVYDLENYWLKDVPYNGVNTNLRNRANVRTEIQFHTPDSYRVKMSEEDHELYKTRCKYEKGSREYEEIVKKQLKLYAGMPVPERIDEIRDI